MLSHQIIDTGLDETSCFFVHDEEGDQIPHGYYFDEISTNFIWTSYSFSDSWYSDDWYNWYSDDRYSDDWYDSWYSDDWDFSSFDDSFFLRDDGGSFLDDSGVVVSAADHTTSSSYSSSYSSSFFQSYGIFSEGDFSAFPDRRKVSTARPSFGLAAAVSSLVMGRMGKLVHTSVAILGSTAAVFATYDASRTLLDG